MTAVAGKRVLVTGGSRGLGLEIASRLAGLGAEVILWARDPERLEAAARSLPGRASWRAVDVSDREAVKAAAAATLAEGPIDVLVNNAGVVAGKPLLELSDADIERTFQTNTLAHFWTLRAFLPAMLARGDGHVVTVASAAAVCAVPRLADYSASKAAAFALDEALRHELHRSRSRVRTTVVCPFYIDTGMFAGAKTRFSLLLPILAPGVVADRIVRAILHDRRRVVVPRIVAITWLARLLPVAWFDAIASVLGVTSSMDDFRGHAPRPARALEPARTSAPAPSPRPAHGSSEEAA